METTGINYNPHQMVELRKIVNGESTFAYYKATELEEMLFSNPTITALEHMPNGELKEHTLTRSDISELYRIAQFRDARLEQQEKQIGQILDNLTADGWYSSNVDKESILSDLCEILGHEPKQTVTINANVTVEVTYEIPLDEVEDFDARYFLQDNLTIDSYHGDVIVETWDIDDTDVSWS